MLGLCVKLVKHKRWFIVRRITIQYIARERAAAIEREYMRKKRCAEVEAYKNSEKGIAEAKERSILQNAYYKSENERLQKVQELQELRNSIFEGILADLNLVQSGEKVELDEDKVAETMAKYQPEIDKLKELGEKHEKHNRGNYVMEYIRLYRDLISTNDAFIKTAPIEVFYNSVVLQPLGLGVNAKYKDYFVKNGFFKDEKFNKINNKFFTGVNNINSIDDFRKIKKELVINPALYSNINETMKRSIMESQLMIKDLLSLCPATVKYMTDEEIYNIGEKCSALLGSVIERKPDVLENFPADFFAHNKPKAIFARVSRQNTHHACVKYYKKFPELYAYMLPYLEKLNFAEAPTEAKIEL